MARATIYEVASRAGVSITTVSRVLNDKGPVAEATRHRIVNAIRELGYEPSWLGRALAGQRRNAVGIVFPDLAGPYHAGVIAGLEAWAAASDVALFILGTHRRRQSSALVEEFAQHVDGLVLTAQTVQGEELERLLDQGVKVVLLGQPVQAGVPAVRVESQSYAKTLTEHFLVDHGLQHLGFLGDPNVSPDIEERWQGFLDGHVSQGRRPPGGPWRTSLRESNGYKAAIKLLAGRRRLEAIVCANDELALGVYTAAVERGLRIPQDLRVSGWDDIPQARWAVPGLTTIHQPLEALGQRAGEILTALLEGKNLVAATTWIPSTLIIRQSCGCGGEREEAAAESPQSSIHGAGEAKTTPK